MSDEDRKSNGRHGVAISGSYLVNAVLGLALAYIWSQFGAMQDRSFKNQLEIVALKSAATHQASDIREIKSDVKSILRRMQGHGTHASANRHPMVPAPGSHGIVSHRLPGSLPDRGVVD